MSVEVNDVISLFEDLRANESFVDYYRKWDGHPDTADFDIGTQIGKLVEKKLAEKGLDHSPNHTHLWTAVHLFYDFANARLSEEELLAKASDQLAHAKKLFP